MATDWVPLEGYDTGASLSADQNDIDLMDPQNWQLPSQVVGTVEDENTAYKILRIVGYWTLSYDVGEAPSGGYVMLRCWPGFQNTLGGSDVPGPLSIPPFALGEVQVAANEKWWWERIVPWQDVNDDAFNRWDRVSAVNDPYAYMADFKPNMWMGDSFSPVLTIQNNLLDGQGGFSWAFFRHRWRALIAH